MDKNSSLEQVVIEVNKLSTNMSVFETWYLIATIIIAIISFFALYESKNSSKASLLHQVKNSINDAKTQIENLTLELSELRSKKKLTADEQRQKDIQEKIFESAIEKLLNVYDDACQKYFANSIPKNEFKKSYFNDIRKYIESFPEKFQEPLTEYNFMLRLYTKWHKVK